MMAPIIWLLWRLANKDHSGWWTFGWMLVLTGVERFVVEFVRRNEEVALGLTQPQWVAIASVVIGDDARPALPLAPGRARQLLRARAVRRARRARASAQTSSSPASTGSATPVMCFAASEASQTTASRTADTGTVGTGRTCSLRETRSRSSSVAPAPANAS